MSIKKMKKKKKNTTIMMDQIMDLALHLIKYEGYASYAGGGRYCCKVCRYELCSIDTSYDSKPSPGTMVENMTNIKKHSKKCSFALLLKEIKKCYIN